MRTLSKVPNSRGFREVQVAEEIIIETHTTEDIIMTLFTSKNPQWSAFLIERKTGMPNQTVDGALRRMVRRGVLQRQNGKVKTEKGWRSSVIYSLKK